MKAVVIHASKDLRVEDAATGEAGPNDVVVRIDAGGICGSDLHYYNHGGFGAIRLQEPMILGHEIAGTVEVVGNTVTSVRPGDRVAVNPSLPCRSCRYCRQAAYNHCLDMRFYGSAMRMPHIQGAFRQSLVVDADQCHVFSNDVSANEAAFAELLAVALHAVSRAGLLYQRLNLLTHMMEENRSPARRFAKGDAVHRSSGATLSGGRFSSTEGRISLAFG